MEQRRCPQCDSPCAVDAKFCANCGAIMTASSPATEPAWPTNREPTSTTANALDNPATPAQVQDMAPVPYQQPVQQYPYQQPVQRYPYQQPLQQPYPQAPQNPYPQAPIQQVNVVMANNAAPAIILKQKSVGIALLLTFLFGPLGMFYSTISGAVIMLIVSVVLGAFTLGISVLITWPICMIWGAIAANSYNNTIVTRI